MAPTMQVACQAFIAPNSAARSPKERYTHVPRLVPRTRSSHHNCRESGCELRVQSGTRIIELLPFDSEVRKRVCPQNDANFGIGALVRRSMHFSAVPLTRRQTRFGMGHIF